MEGSKGGGWVVVVGMMMVMLVCAAREAKAIEVVNLSDVAVNAVVRVNAAVAGNVTVGAHVNATVPLLLNVTVGARLNVTFVNLVTNVSASVNVTDALNSVFVIENNVLNRVVIYSGTVIGGVLTLINLLVTSF